MFSFMFDLHGFQSTGYMHNDIHHKITNSIMYWFAIVLSQYGPTKSKTKVVAARMGSNLSSGHAQIDI